MQMCSIVKYIATSVLWLINRYTYKDISGEFQNTGKLKKKLASYTLIFPSSNLYNFEPQFEQVI